MAGWRHFGRIHTWLYRLSGGRILGEVGLGRRILLLSTRGRRSGRVRTSPLVYLDDAGRYVVYGSNGGQERPPAWLLNLRDTPRAEVEIGRRRIAVRARVAQGEEERTLLPRAHAYNPHWAGYQKQAQRHIPLVILEPVGQSAGA